MIEISHLQKKYSRKDLRPVLEDISLTLPDTGFVCILGQSGCGKTSLLNAIGGLDDFQKGTVSTDGVQIRPGHHRQADKLRSTSFGYIFQNYYLLSEHSVQYNVYLGLHGVNMTHKEKMERVKEALERVDMVRFSRRKVSDLSGGQQQRIAIARALAPSPKVIFADEPTGNLDEANTMNICGLLRSISKTALVVMVTHETRLARFFADRIITLKDGSVNTDTTDWVRSPMEAGNDLYSDDYENTTAAFDGFTLNLYRQSEALPVSLTVLSLNDRIIIKTNDSRRIICSEENEEPVIHSGKRPVITLSSIEQDNIPPFPRPESGNGKLSLSWKLREILFLMREKGLYRIGMMLFLAILTAFSCFVYSDFKTISSVDPKDFITSDSHLVDVILDRGPEMPETKYITDYPEPFLNVLLASDIPFRFLPTVSTPATYHTDLVLQLSDISESLGSFSYIPISELNSDALIAGRMPENSQEVVIDCWVLENFLKKDGLVQNSIPGVTYFLGKELNYLRKNYSPTIVGICDSGQCAMYIPESGLISLGVGGHEVIGLSELQKLFPGKYDSVTLSEESCIMVANNAGSNYLKEIGGIYRTKTGMLFTIADAITEDTYASMVVDDAVLPEIMMHMAANKIVLYCYDKEAMLHFLSQPLPEDLEGEIQIQVVDHYGDAMRAYQSAAKLRADSRTIVTVTVIFLSLTMLYLIRRSQLQKRLGMMAVYRLLGIPSRELCTIFCGEAFAVSLLSSLPAAFLTWLGFRIAGYLPSLKFTMLFSFQDTAMVFLCVLLFYEAISLLPAIRILRKPPAQIARQIN